MRNYRATIKCKKINDTDKRLKLDEHKTYRDKTSTATNEISKLKHRAQS